MLDPAVQKEPTIGRSLPDLVGPTGSEPGKQTRVQETYGKTAGLMLRSSETETSARPAPAKRAKGPDDKIGEEIDKDSAIRQKHVIDAGERPLVSGEDPRPPGLKNAHEELARGRYFWMPYIKGGSRKLEAFLEDIQNGTTAVYARCVMAQRTENDAERSFFEGWATRLDNQVAMIHLARRVWFNGNWADPDLQQATSWSDLISRSEIKLASGRVSGAAQSAFQSRVAGFRALADVSDPEFIDGAMQAVHTANAGWKTAPEPPATAQADATKSGGQSGNVVGNQTVMQEATRAATIAKRNSPAADQRPENAHSQVEPRAQFVANNHKQGDPELQRDVNYSERVLAENRDHAYNADVKSHLIGQDKVNATMENEENPLPEDTYQRLLAIWRDGFWLQNPPDHAELVKLQKILSYAGSMFNHQQLVLHRDLPRVGPGVEHEAEVMHMQMHFTTYKMQVNDQYHNVVDARYWLDHWKRRLELAAAFWGGEKGAWVRKNFPNAKSAQDVEAGIASLVKQQTDNKQGWFFGLHLSDEQQSAVYSLQKVSEELHYFTDFHKSGGKTFRLEWWGRPSGASAV